MGNRHIMLLRDHDIYGCSPSSSTCDLMLTSYATGPIVRNGPNSLSFKSTDALKAIYSSGKTNTQKGKWYNVHPAASKDWTTHSVIDRKEHSYKRRVLSAAFSDSAIRDAQSFILENVRTWTKVLQTPKSGEKSDGWSEKRNMGESLCTICHQDRLDAMPESRIC